MRVGHLRACHTSRALRWWMLMSEYTHNDDVAEMLYSKDREIAELKEILTHLSAEIRRLETYCNGI